MHQFKKESIHLEKNRFIFMQSGCFCKTCEKQFQKICACSYHMVILPVDQSARVLPRQRYLPLDRLCTTLAFVLHTSILLKNLQKTEWRRSRSDAQVSDRITKTLREKS